MALAAAIVVGLALPEAHAQDVTDDVIQQVIEPATEVSAESALEQLQDGSVLGLTSDERDLLSGFSLADQGSLVLLSQGGGDNEATILQQGFGNAAVLVQDGSGILTSISQNGTGNVFGVELVGDNLELSQVTQEGERNVYLLEYTGSDLLIAPAVQSGVDNQAVQIGDIETPFGVQQYGNGQRLIIQHNGAQ